MAGDGIARFVVLVVYKSGECAVFGTTLGTPFYSLTDAEAYAREIHADAESMQLIKSTHVRVLHPS